jgi:protein-S-isoprenylcysteine O-methyltransferase Ste14
VLGATLLGAGLLLGGLAVKTLRQAGTSPNPQRPTTALVTTGPYRYTRNPIYLAMAMIYAGIATSANALAPFALLPLALLALDRGMIAREERYLEGRFGELYRAYKARTPRWL